MSIIPFVDEITIYKGSTFDERWDFFTDDAETVIETLTGQTGAMKVRKTFDGPVLLTVTNGTPSASVSAIEVDGAAGTVRVYLTDEDTGALSAADFLATVEGDGSTTYSGVFDIELTNAGGEVFRRVMGQVFLSPEVTY